MLITLGTNVAHDERMYSIDWRLEVKVTIDKSGNNLVCTIEIKLFSVFRSNLAQMLAMMRA